MGSVSSGDCPASLHTHPKFTLLSMCHEAKQSGAFGATRGLASRPGSDIPWDFEDAPSALFSHLCSGPQVPLQGSAWPSCSTEAGRQVAVLGQQRALSWAGFPSTQSTGTPTWSLGWVRWCWPHYTPRIGHACWCHPGTQGPMAPPSAVVRRE